MPTTIAAVVRMRPPRNTMGRPGIRPSSFPEATSEPVKVTEPMRTSRMMKNVSQPSSPAPLCELRRRKSSMARIAAAPPPTALNSETSCGMDVIATDRAIHSPVAPPAAKPPKMISQFPGPGFSWLM